MKEATAGRSWLELGVATLEMLEMARRAKGVAEAEGVSDGV